MKPTLNIISLVIIFSLLFCTVGLSITPARAAGAWENVGAAAFSTGAIQFLSFALDAGVPYVAFQDSTHSDKATVMKYNGSSWETVGPAGFSADVVEWTSLAFHEGTPYIAYRDLSNESSQATVMKYNGSNWETVGPAGFSAGRIYFPSLAFDGGTPYVAYTDLANDYKSTLMKYNGSSWETVGAAGFSAGEAYFPSMAFEGGMPYVAYRDGSHSDKATVMRYNGSNWETVGAAGFSAGEAYSPSMAFDGGMPYVAYKDVGNDNKATVMKYNGSSWETVGPGGFSAGLIEHPSLVFNGGMLYLAYADMNYGGRAVVMKYNGNSWETVGPAGFSAGGVLSPSLAFDGGTPYVAYIEASNGHKATVMKFELPEIIPPTIDTFTVPATSTSLDIPITAFTASDDVGVTGYLITESSTPPLPDDTGWSSTSPVTYTVGSAGSYTLYPWAKDAVGNVSTVFDSPRTVTVDIADIGVISGTVYADDGVTPLADIYVAVSGGNYFASTCTDASGQFAFSDLPFDEELQAQASPPWGRCSEWHDYVLEYWPEKTDQTGAGAITLTLENPERTDIDFTLDAGGVISGTAYTATGGPLFRPVTILVQSEYGYYSEGLCSDENGHYEFHGVPLDMSVRVSTYTYHEGWCSGGGYYLPEYWQEVHETIAATYITLTEISPARTGIDFTLDPAGSISGMVYEADGITPIPSVSISSSQGDACTDSSGHYTIPNVPFGVRVPVRAGGSSCDGAGYFEEEFWPGSPNLSGASLVTVSAEAPDATGIDFTLSTITPPDTDPWMRTWYMDNMIEVNDWPADTHLTVEIEDLTTPLSPDYSTEADVTELQMWLPVDSQFEIKPGMYVFLSGASLIRAMKVNNLTIAEINEQEDTITGTANPNDWLWMYFDQSCDPTCRSTVAGGRGIWTIDYSIAGDEGQPAADIGPGSSGAVHVPSGDNGSTSVGWAASDANIDVWYLDGFIEAFGWSMGSHLTLEIEDPSTTLSPDYSAETDVTETVPWEPTMPYATFNVDDTFEMEPGMIVTVSGEYMTRKIVVDNLTITSVDQDTDTITGTTGPNNWMWMYFEPSCTPTCRSTVADETGDWTIDYSVPGPDGQPTADIGPSSSGAIHVPSGDGRTSVGWSVPPKVISVTRATASPTSAASVNFLVTFSENVNDVDADDFSLDVDGEIADVSITNVGGSGSVRTVTVNTGSGSGTIGLDVPVTASITDLDGNPLTDLPFITGEVYAVEKLPDRATLVWPGGDINTKTPTYNWNKVNGATWYYLWVNGPSGTVIKQWYAASAICSGGTCSVTPPMSLSPGFYIWWVQTWNNAGYGSWSDGLSFIVPAPLLPGKAALFSPSGSAGTNHPTYSWSEVSGVDWYYLWVNGPSGTVIKQWYAASAICSGGTCSVTPPMSLSPGSYIWWVQTWSNAGYGPWSNALNFTVPAPLPPGQAALFSPSGSAGTNHPTYSWSEVSGATWYYLWMNGPAGNMIKQWYAASAICSGGTCSVTPPMSLSPGSYIWWVQTWNPVGYGPWSDRMDFSVP